MKRHTYRILLNREPKCGYTLAAPALPGYMTYGVTVDEAITSLVTATSLPEVNLTKVLFHVQLIISSTLTSLLNKC